MADASHEYIDPEQLGRLVRWSLIVFMVACAVNIVSTSFEYQLLARISNEGAFPGMEEEAEANDMRQLIVAIPLLLVFLASGFLILRWIWRSSKNLHTTGAAMDFTPGWAVGWYFIPVAHLWKPYQAMREIWDRSMAGGDSPSRGLLGCWWVAWVISGISDNISLRMSFSDDLDRLLLGDALSMIGDAGSIVAAAFLLPIVARVTKSQRDMPRISEAFS